MDKRHHDFLNALVAAGHPFPGAALKRVIYAKSRTGAGLSKIPTSVVEEDYQSKKEATQVVEGIEDSIGVEATYLARKDLELENTFGFATALAYYYRDEEGSDQEIADKINNIDLPIKTTPEIPAVLTGGESIPRRWSTLFREIDEVFKDDVVRGRDHNDSDRKRFVSQIRTMIEQIGG